MRPVGMILQMRGHARSVAFVSAHRAMAAVSWRMVARAVARVMAAMMSHWSSHYEVLRLRVFFDVPYPNLLRFLSAATNSAATL